MMGSKLIALIVIVLGVIAIAQLVRVYELSSKLRKRGEHEITTRDNNLNGRLMLLFMFLFYASFIYLMLAYGWTGRGEAASTIGVETDWLLDLNFIIIIAVFFLTNSLLFYFTYKYVRKAGVKALYFPHSNRLELIWTIVPAIVLAVIIVLGLKKWNDATNPSGKEAIKIELFSKQFDWTARYSGMDNQLGFFDYKLTTDKNELALLATETIDSAIFNMENGATGMKALEQKLNDRTIMLIPEDREKMEVDLSRKQRLIRLLYQMKEKHDSRVDAKAWDDIIQKDTLFLCVNKEYDIALRAKDVIHSAFFMHFRMQLNAVPGMSTHMKFTPTITTNEMRIKRKDEKFNYILMCNKICGGAHYKMKMTVVVLAQNEYKAWMNSKKKATFRDTYFGAPAAESPAVMDSLAVPSVDTTMVANVTMTIK
jgi:cytochrome c oxidase subunit 2